MPVEHRPGRAGSGPRPRSSAPGALRQEAAAELAKRTQEYWQLRSNDLAKHRDPKNVVFMHIAGVEGDPMLQIIEQLTGAAGLEWGGTHTTQSKDLHHFALKI